MPASSSDFSLPATCFTISSPKSIAVPIPFEVKINHPAYTKAEAVKEVEATMAFEGMELTEEDMQILYAYKNGEASGDELRKRIVGEAG